jgi:AraC-like DNA-binding protein
MLCACDLLKKDPAPLREIGEKIGIRLPQHFTRLFKRTFKMTPSQFRRHGRMPDF